MTAYVFSAGVSSGGITLNAGDTLTVLSGATAGDITVGSGGTETVLAGGGTTGTIVRPGGIVTVNGGSALDTTVSALGQIQLENGGVGSGTTVILGGVDDVFAGGTAISTTVNNNSVEIVWSGGTASDTIVDGGGTLIEAPGGTVVSPTIHAGGAEITTGFVVLLPNGGVSAVSPGTAASLEVLAGTPAFVLSGGIAYSAGIESGAEMDVWSGGLGDDITVFASGALGVRDGGTVTSSLAIQDGLEQVFSGGSVVSAAATSGGHIFLDGGSGNLLLVSGSGSELAIASGGSGTQITLQTGGTVEVQNGGQAIDTEVFPNAYLTVSSGGAAIVGYVNSDGAAFAFSGGILSSFYISSGGKAFLSGGESDFATIAYGGTEVVSSGGLAINVSAGGDLDIGNGGSAVEAVAIGSGNIFVFSGGQADSINVAAGGYAAVSSGGAINGFTLIGVPLPAATIYGGGTLIALSGATMNGGIEFAPLTTEGGQFVTYNPSALTTIGGFEMGDVLVAAALPFLSAGSATLDSGDLLTISQGGNTFAAQFDSSLTGDTLSWTADPIAGTDIELTYTVISLTAPNTADNLNIGATQVLDVNPGAAADDTTVSNGGVVNISNTGSTYFTLLYNGGTQYVLSGGLAGATAAFGGQEVVSSGGVADGSVIYAGATQSVLSGGSANDTVLGQFGTPGGTEQVANGGTAISASIGNGGTLVVAPFAAVSATTIKAGGTLELLSGATASGVTIDAGANIVISNGGTLLDPVDNGGLLFVTSGMTVVDPDTAAGGFIVVLPGGIVSGTVASGANLVSTGVLLVQNGEVVQYGPELDGLSIPYQGTPEYVLSGGITDGSRIYNGGAEYVLGGVAEVTSVSGDGEQYVASGGTASDTILDGDGQEIVASGGVLAGGVTFTGNGNLLVVSNTGSAGTRLLGFNDADTLDAAALPFVGAGSGTLTSAYALTVTEDGQSFTAQFDSSDSFATFGWSADGSGGTDIKVLYDTLFVSGAGVVSSGIVLSAGANIDVYSGGVTSNTVLNNGANEYVSAGGTAIATNVGYGPAYQYVYSGGVTTGTVFNGGAQVIESGAVDSGTTVYNGSEILSSGGTSINDEAVNGGGITVSSGATASGTFVSFQGALVVDSGGTAVGGSVIYGGNLYVSSGGSAVSVTLESGDNFTVSSGGTALDITMTDAANINLVAGSIVSGTIVNSGGIDTLKAGVTDTGTNLEAFGTEIVSGGGVSYFTMVGKGGWETISSGGVASGTIVESGGVLVISSGGVAFSPNVAAGGEVIVLAGGTVSGTPAGAGLVVSTGVVVAALGSGIVTQGASFTGLAVQSGQVDYILSGGTTTGTGVSAFGREIVNAGIASNTTLLSATALTDSTVPATEIVVSGGIAIGTTEQYLTQIGVQAGGVISNAQDQGGAGFYYLSMGGTALGVTLSSGTEYVFGGGVASNSVVDNGGFMNVFGGATAFDTTINDGGGVGGDGVLSNVTIVGGGLIELQGPATGNIEFVGSGGVIDIFPGGVLSAPILGFEPGDTIALAGAVNATVTLEPGNVLSASGNGEHFSIQLDPTQNFTHDVFSVANGAQFTIFSNAGEITASIPGFVPPVLATGAVAPISEYLHVGAPGTVALAVSNTGAAGGTTENLLASIAGVSGNVTIAAAGPTGEIAAGGNDATSLQLGFVTSGAGTISGTATVDLTSDGGTGSGSIDGDGTTALSPTVVPVAITVENFANPVFEDESDTGMFTPGTTAYTLDLGTVPQGTDPVTVNLGVVNSTTGPSDVLTGSLSAIGSSAFTNSGMVSIGSLAAGQSDIAPEITLATGTTGTFSETITLASTGSNPGGYSAAFSNETLTVTGTVVAPLIAPAIATVLSPNPVNFGALHLLTNNFQRVVIGNTATTGAAALDVSSLSVSGAADESGYSIFGLAPGATDTIDVTVGLDTTVVGPRSGDAVLAFVSDGGTLGSVDLPNGTIAVTGTVYREAAAALLPLNAIVHVGDPGTISLPVGNSDPADGYSENLIASLIGVTGGLGIASAGPTADIVAGDTNTNTLALSFSTAQAGTVSGSATVGLISDGTGIDGLGQTTLTAGTVAVNITVDNYATATVSSDGHLTSTGPDSYVLNLGTATQGAAALSADLDVGNSATGTADWLNGSLSATGSAQFVNSALGPVSDITAGTSADAGAVSLSTSQTGVFSETIMLAPTSANADGKPDPRTAQSVTVTGTIVAPTGTAQGDVHMVTFDGLHYDFQAIGDFVLTRSTVPGDTFQIQIETEADPSIAAVSITTQVAAQVGPDVVTFGVDPDNLVWVDGAPDTALNANDPVQDLSGGQLTELSPTEFRLTWATGEALTVNDQGPILNTAASLPVTDGAGSVQGLLGSDGGQANDFQLANGSVIPQPLSGAELYGAFANAWRGDSLLAGVNPMQFIYADGTSGQTVEQATAPGQILSGVNVLSDAGGFGVTFLGSLSELTNETITGFTSKDVIDVTNLDSAAASVSYLGTSSSGVLQVSDGVRTGTIQLSGQVSGTVQLAPDTHGGTLIRIS